MKSVYSVTIEGVEYIYAITDEAGTQKPTIYQKSAMTVDWLLYYQY